MSAELFLESNTSQNKELLELSNEARRNYETRSPIIFLTETLIDKAHQGMRSYSQNYEREDDKLVDLARGYVFRDEARIEYAASVFGNIILELDNIMDKGIFDLESFIERTNQSLVGTAIPNLPAADSTREKKYSLSEKELQTFYETYRNDPSYASFFNRRNSKFPANFQKYAHADEHLLGLTGYTLPLVAREWKSMAKHFLYYYDSLYERNLGDLEQIYDMKRQGFTNDQLNYYTNLSTRDIPSIHEQEQ